MATITQEPPVFRSPLPPGPRGFPFIGNLLAMRRDQLRYFEQLQRRYGNLATIHLGRLPVVLLFRPEYVHYVLVEHPRQFSNSGLPQNGDETVASEGLLTIDGEKHRQQRRAVQPAFHKKQVEGYFSTMQQYTNDLLHSWHVGEQVDLSRAMQELTLRIVSKCLFSIDLSNQLRPLGSAFTTMIGTQAGIVENLFNLHIDSPLTSYGKRLAATRHLDTLLYTLIAQRREDLHDQNDVLSMLLSARVDESSEDVLNEKQVRDHLLTFIAAGHETTANALVWTFYLLAKHSRIREKVLEEIKTVVADRAVTMEDLGRLTYTDWVLKEALRLYPPAWFQARFSVSELEFDGVKIPSGTLLMVSQWVIHRLPEIWNEPQEFRPERWNPENNQQLPPGVYFPFGAGPRMCIGMPFAQLEAKLVLVSLLQQFIPQPPPDYEPGLNPLITLRPKNNLHVTLLSPTGGLASRVPPVHLFSSSSGIAEQGCRPALLNWLGFS